MPEWLRMAAASLLGTFGFGLLAGAPKKSWIPASLLGAMTFVLYWFMAELGLREPAALFLASLTGSMVGLICARYLHMIGTIFLMMSIISFVPGLGLYRSMQFLGAGESAAGADQAVQAMETIAMIVLGQIGGNLFFRGIHYRRRKKA